MSKSLKNYFRRLAEGYERGPLVYLLLPLLVLGENAFRVVTSISRGLYEKKIAKRTKLPYPVISIGNLTWGGTGKTPLVEYVARKIGARNKTPLILTRGYSHDEVEQFKHHVPEALIGVGKERLKVAHEVAKDKKIDVAILDDGLQHWPIARELEIITINALNPFGNKNLIPRGILREPLSILSRAEIVVISHANLVKADELSGLREIILKHAPNAQIVETYLEPLFFFRARKRARVTMDRLMNQRVTTFSGVGVPKSFQLLLSRSQIRPVRNFEFTDHHKFSEKELNEIKSVSESASVDEIVTTEKDFYRDPELISKVLNPLVLATKLRVKSGEDALLEKIFRLTRI